ncbi:MAG: DEAD/DEAH box helicase, partial [Kiritimatiellae bacterium]|nr:DEAD/DEAH box helicase [Kiritimatiellia bacterium]
NPATESQATDRAHRIGQAKTVFVHTFICDGTLESKIDELISDKRELAGKVVADGAGWLANLDDKRLMEVISLSRQ